jgi:hypothetical protein
MKRDDKQIMKEFQVRQNRQLLALAITLLLLLFFVLVFKHPDIFGVISKNTIFAAQILTIAAFIGFSVVNWRCPACNKYLGSDIHRRACSKCGTRLR